MFHRTIPILACLLAIPSIASAAESVGNEGYVVQLEVNSTSADKYLQYHGRVVLGGKQSVSEYRWGGTSCGTRILTDTQVALLTRALDGGLRVRPLYQLGQGDLQCMVGFTLLS